MSLNKIDQTDQMLMDKKQTPPGGNMKTVFKYSFNERINNVQMPKGAEPVHFGMQNGVPSMWAIVEPGVEMEIRRFFIIGTGHPIPPMAKSYIGTVEDGPFVWHLFGDRI